MCNNKTLKDEDCSHVNEQIRLFFLLLTSIFVAEHHQLSLSNAVRAPEAAGSVYVEYMICIILIWEGESVRVQL